MKSIVLIFCIILTLNSLQAQIITHGLISSNGDYYTNSSVQLNFSEGVVIDEFVFTAATSLPGLLTLIHLIIYPNPVTDFITVHSPQPSRIDLLDVGGKVIRTLNSNNENTIINVSGWSKGIYIVKASTDDGVWVEKFIKK